MWKMGPRLEWLTTIKTTNRGRSERAAGSGQRAADLLEMAGHQNKTPETTSPNLHPAGSGRFNRFLKRLAPGLITGASDDDPSGIATYATAGASLGFATLWTAIFTFPMMIVIEYVCAKVGLVSGAGLANAIKTQYSRKVL